MQHLFSLPIRNSKKIRRSRKDKLIRKFCLDITPHSLNSFARTCIAASRENNLSYRVTECFVSKGFFQCLVILLLQFASTYWNLEVIDSRLRNLRTLLSSFVLGCSEKLSYIKQRYFSFHEC